MTTEQELQEKLARMRQLTKESKKLRGLEGERLTAQEEERLLKQPEREALQEMRAHEQAAKQMIRQRAADRAATTRAKQREAEAREGLTFRPIAGTQAAWRRVAGPPIEAPHFVTRREKAEEAAKRLAGIGREGLRRAAPHVTAAGREIGALAAGELAAREKAFREVHRARRDILRSPEHAQARATARMGAGLAKEQARLDAAVEREQTALTIKAQQEAARMRAQAAGPVATPRMHERVAERLLDLPAETPRPQPYVPQAFTTPLFLQPGTPMTITAQQPVSVDLRQTTHVSPKKEDLFGEPLSEMDPLFWKTPVVSKISTYTPQPITPLQDPLMEGPPIKDPLLESTALTVPTPTPLKVTPIYPKPISPVSPLRPTRTWVPREETVTRKRRKTRKPKATDPAITTTVRKTNGVEVTTKVRRGKRGDGIRVGVMNFVD